MSKDTVCEECGAPLDPDDGYCSHHQPSRTGLLVTVTNTQGSASGAVKTSTVSGSTSYRKSDWSTLALIVAIVYFMASLSELGFRFGWISVSGLMESIIMGLQLATTFYLVVYSLIEKSYIVSMVWSVLFVMNLLAVLFY